MRSGVCGKGKEEKHLKEIILSWKRDVWHVVNVSSGGCGDVDGQQQRPCWDACEPSSLSLRSSTTCDVYRTSPRLRPRSTLSVTTTHRTCRGSCTGEEALRLIQKSNFHNPFSTKISKWKQTNSRSERVSQLECSSLYNLPWSPRSTTWATSFQQESKVLNRNDLWVLNMSWNLRITSETYWPPSSTSSSTITSLHTSQCLCFSTWV